MHRGIITLVLLIGVCGSLGNSKISPRVSLLFSDYHLRTTRAEKVNLWVYFNDKGPSPSLPNAAADLHPTSLERRRKMKFDSNLVDMGDVPVYSGYILQVESTGVTVRRTSKWLNAVSVTASAASSLELEKAIRRITDLSCVSMVDVMASYTRPVLSEESLEEVEVQEEEKVRERGEHARERATLSYGNSFDQLSMIGVTDAHARGYNGTGVVVIILDSGFLKDHPALTNLKIIAEYDFVDNQTNTQSYVSDPQNLHGTGTLSNIGGWAPGYVIGSGFGASFILAKTEILADEYRVEEDNFIAAIEWGESLGAHVVSASLGYTQWYTFYQIDGTISPVTVACDLASKRGMVVVVSAGNSGSAGIATPADGFEVIAVGSVSPGGSLSTFSSLGPAADGRTKPDISARGYRNWAANCWQCTNTQDRTSNYTTMSGTSFSCPLVAGVVTILLQAHPSWTPSMVREALRMTASEWWDPSSTVGWGIVNANAAIDYTPASGDCTVNGCNNQGCCVNGTCQCTPGYFGTFCNFQKDSCSSFCSSRTGTQGVCLLQPSGESHRCGPPGKTKVEVVPILQCDGCPKDFCDTCYGYNTTCLIGCDGILNSTIRFDNCHVCGGDNSTCKVTAAPVVTTGTHYLASSGNSHSPNVFLITLCTLAGVVFTYQRFWQFYL